MQGIDILGLDGQDRKYLETIIRVFHGGPVGVEAVGHTMNLAPDYAGRRGRAVSAAQRAGRAHAARRKATPLSYSHLGLAAPLETEQPRLF